MFYRNRFLLFLLIIFLFSSNIDFSVTPTKSNPARISIESVDSSDSDSTTLSTPWIYPNRNYYSYYTPRTKRRQNGTCWKAPQKARRIAIVAIFLNESHGMHEWLDHYMWQGIDEILLLEMEVQIIGNQLLTNSIELLLKMLHFDIIKFNIMKKVYHGFVKIK